MRDDSLAATIAQARDALRAGNAWLCFDIVERAQARGLQAPQLEYLAILALAHCGSTQQALDRYHRSPRTADEADQDWFALEGRLFKDLALHGGAGARFMFERAAQAYLQAFRRTGGYFSAVNAASMLLLSGDEAQARALAADVMALTEGADRDTSGDEIERYHQLVSHAEAALLLGELDRCRKALRAADLLARDHRSTRARTVRQLQLLCRQRRADKTIPLLLTVPPQVFVHRAAAITLAIPPAPAGQPAPALPIAAGAAAFVSLIDPVDVCVAERLLAGGVHVTAAIAGGREPLMQAWQQAHGAAWSLRLARALDHVGEVTVVPGFMPGEPLWLQRRLAAQSLGLSRHAPEPMRSQWSALIVEPGGEPAGFALRALEGSRLREIERSLADPLCPLSEAPRTPGLRERRVCALLVVRFGAGAAHDDAALLRLRQRVLLPLAQRLAEHAPKLLWRHDNATAWQFAVADAASAAVIATLCQAHGTEPAPEDGSTAAPQLLLHAGPVFVGNDAFGDNAAFGSALDTATVLASQLPPGSFLATQAYVAQFHLEGAQGYRFEYVGEPVRAPAYSGLRLFSLRPDQER
jgi:hypothetical protein